MGYRITYTQVPHKKILISKRSTRFNRLITSVVIVSFLITIGWIGWSNHTFRYWLLPGDPKITEHALEELVVDLKEGKELSDAIASFCCEIISNA